MIFKQIYLSQIWGPNTFYNFRRNLGIMRTNRLFTKLFAKMRHKTVWIEYLMRVEWQWHFSDLQNRYLSIRFNLVSPPENSFFFFFCFFSRGLRALSLCEWYNQHILKSVDKPRRGEWKLRNASCKKFETLIYSGSKISVIPNFK